MRIIAVYAPGGPEATSGPVIPGGPVTSGGPAETSGPDVGGVLQPAFRVVGPGGDVAAAGEKIGWPVVVKPISRWEIWIGKWLGIMTLNAMEFLFTPGRVTILGEFDGNRTRRIYTDGRGHPEHSRGSP